MFVNNMEWCSRHSIFSKGDIVLKLLGCALSGDSIYLRRYPNSTGTLYLVSEESKELHMTCLRFEI